MLVRHFGIYVKDIEKVTSILIKLGLEKVYDVMESPVLISRKFRIGNGKIEILKNIYFNPDKNITHLSFDGEIPEFMKKYHIESLQPFDSSLEVDMVFIDDSIYFEFVRRKD